MENKRKGLVALLLLKTLVSNKGTWSVFGKNEQEAVICVMEISEIYQDEARDFISFVNDSIRRLGPRGLPRVLTQKQGDIADTCLRHWISKVGFEFNEHSLDGMVRDLCTRENDVYEEELIDYWSRVMIQIIAKRCMPDSTVAIDDEICV